MERTISRLLPIVLLACAVAIATAQQSSILIEFSRDSEAHRQWIRTQRQGQVEALTGILGTHTTMPYIQTSTLRCVERAMAGGSLAKQNISRSIDRLERYAVVTLTGPRNASMLAAKLRSIGHVQQAQLLPEQRIVGQPNDPEIARQYYLPRIDVYRAWDVLPGGRGTVVAIIDTGVDTAHVDLQGSIWKNPAEMGLDGSGMDKRSNRKDDDGNGFVDDWTGWDFVGVDGTSQDNMPLPGNSHGTHVAGIVAAQVDNAVGIAGVARNVRVMVVKVGRDDPNSESVARSADGILYAAAMGADVINCSFGSSSPSFADVEVVRTAGSLGSLVIGAAGNDALDQAFYPAAYPDAVSVAATDLSDRLAIFSNIHATVDLCAPGVGIFSTIPRNSYTSFNGTSMAAPVVSAVAAMVLQCFPTYSPLQLRAALVASCDDIDTLNRQYLGKFGTGRINAYRACAGESTRWCMVTQHTFADVDGDGVFQSGDTLLLALRLKNVLGDLIDATVELQPIDTSLVLIDSTIAVGPLSSQQEFDLPSPLRFRLKGQLADNERIELRVRVVDQDRTVGSDMITAVANPTYVTIAENDVATTINSMGNIGYNDYSANEQGVGFRYEDSPSLLFEGALMIGTGPLLLPNVVRGDETSLKDMSFQSIRAAALRTDSVVSGARVSTSFADDPNVDGLGLFIRKNVFARSEDSLRNSILVVLDISNVTGAAINGIFTAYFFDFDIGANGANNVCSWDAELGAFLHRNVLDATLPMVAMTMVSSLPLNGFAVDNDGSFDCPSIYDDFSRSEKWFMMSQGLRRRASTPTDASTVIGAGPFALEPGAAQQVAWILTAGMNKAEIVRGLQSMRNAASAQGVDVQPYTPIPLYDGIKHIAGSPLVSSGTRDLVFSLSLPSDVVIDMIDVTGRSSGILYKASNVVSGDHQIVASIPDVAQGAYYLRLNTAHSITLFPIGLVR